MKKRFSQWHAAYFRMICQMVLPPRKRGYVDREQRLSVGCGLFENAMVDDSSTKAAGMQVFRRASLDDIASF